MNNLELYVKHCAGFYSLLVWLDKESKDGIDYQISNQIILFNKLISRYFSFGITKNSKEIFLAIQPNEKKWFSLILWDKVILKENDNFIYFLSKIVEGDHCEQPDIPSFAIGLYVDTKDKLNIVSNIKKISGREYYQDETGFVNVNFHQKIFDLEIYNFEENQSIVENETTFNFSDILKNKENEIKNKISDKTEFIGDLVETKSIINNWKQKDLALIKNAEKFK